jgi:hypothetical protein
MEKKIKIFKHGSSQTSSRNSHVNGESSDSKNNVGEESRVPSVITLGARMAKKALKTLDNNNGIQRSTQVKYLVQRLTYDGFEAHCYAYMVKVIQKVEFICFEQAVGNPNGTMPWMKRWWCWMLMLLGNW